MCWLPLLLLAAAPSLTFDEALARVDATPALTAAARAARLRRESLDSLSRLTSNPQLTVQPGMRAESGGGLGPEGYLTLSQGFNLGGLAGARREVARREADQAELEHRLFRRERRISVARAWLSAWAAHGSAAAAHTETTWSRELVTRLERAVASGGATRVELSTAKAFAAEAQALALSWEGREIEALAVLGTLLGERELPHVEGPVPALALPGEAAPGPPARLQARLKQAEASAELDRGAEVKAAAASQLTLSLQGGHERPGQWFGNFGIGATFPFFERAQRERAAHRANAERLSGEQAQAEAAAELEWRSMLHELEHTRRAFEVVSGAQVPAAEEAAELESQRYARGEATLLELTLLRRQALGARIGAFAAEADHAAARARARELLDAQAGAP